MFSVQEPTTLRDRVLQVTREWSGVARIERLLEGHPCTWTPPDRSNLRRLLADMVQKGELESRLNAEKHRNEYRAKPKGQPCYCDEGLLVCRLFNEDAHPAAKNPPADCTGSQEEAASDPNDPTVAEVHAFALALEGTAHAARTWANAHRPRKLLVEEGGSHE